MGCGKEGRSFSFSNLAVVKKSKGNLFTKKPVFCDGGKSLLISLNSAIHMYNTSTGEHVKELFKCADKIISYQLHPLDSSQLIAVTENGELIGYSLKKQEIEFSSVLKLNWKYLNKQKIPKFDLKGSTDENFSWETQPLDSLESRRFLHAEVKPFQKNSSEIFVWASWCLNDEHQAHLSVFTINGKHIRLFNIQNSGLKKCSFNFALGTVEGFEIFVGMSKYYLHVARYDTHKHPFSMRQYLDTEREVTCLALHPTESSFATGHLSGMIVIWKNIFDKQPLKNLLHWHAHQVHDLYFSKFGNYLFSGGEENVLVKWSLSTHNKDFLPRLSSNIHQIHGAPEQSLLSVSTMDNKILILDFNFNKISTIQHFSSWSSVNSKNSINSNRLKVFTVDPRIDCLVLNGRTGHIQFLSLNKDGKFLFTFDITSRTIVSEGEFAIENTEVTHAKFSKDGKWMVTVESRMENVCKESRLKFWLYCNKQNSFQLRTNVEFPHDEFEISDLEISLDDMVGTTGGDKKFRLWSLFEQDQAFGKKDFWGVHAVTKYRNFPCHAIDFSKDASLIAVTFGSVLTVWETGSCVLKCSLAVPDKKDELKFCKFGNNELSHLVVTGAKSVISCWNLITLSITWTVPIELSVLISDPFSVFMVAFSEKNSLIIFNPSSPTPDLVLNKVTDSQVIAAHCVPTENGKFCLYFLTEDQELFCLDDVEKFSEDDDFTSDRQTFSTPYSLQLAEKENREELEKKKSFSLNKNNKKSVLSVLDSPAHALPNPSLLCLDVLKGLIVFSENHSAGVPSGNEVKRSDVIRKKKVSENKTVDYDKTEEKLSAILNSIFV